MIRSGRPRRPGTRHGPGLHAAPPMHTA
ncbi:uncharacterized protein METZ01_LOCUS174513 [marine metagenome]|uniref:Uncharacterized protein n=1 Tax=marine metagenome TaxID=408172 RepID=A0A382C703_9ZZZZ